MRSPWRSEKSAEYAKRLQHAHRLSKRERDANTSNDGERVTTMLGHAAKAARAVHSGDATDDAQWTNRFATLAGCLPAWADDDFLRTPAHTAEVMSAVAYGQDLATEAAEAWRHAAAPAQSWMKHRATERGLLTLVLRCWRERVEHDTPGINNDSSRWIVRRERQQRAGPRTRRTQAGPRCCCTPP